MMGMVDPAVKEQILDDLEHMTEEQQREAARCVHALIGADEPLPPPTSGKDILHLAGIIDAESAREAMEAIREGCKQVDPSEW